MALGAFRVDPAGATALCRVVAPVFWAWALALLAAGCGERGPAEPQSLVLSTGDGWQIAATLYPAPEHEAPGLILVHGYGAARDTWEQVGQHAQRTGYHALAVDLRGHGESTRDDGATLHYRDFPETAWRAAMADLEAARHALLDAGADPDNLAIAGEGFGGSLALHYADAEPTMQGVALISPGLEQQGLRTEPLMARLRHRPILMLVAEQDAHAYTAATVLDQAAEGFCELRAYPGAAHGTDLFAVSPTALQQLFDWLRIVFGEAPVPPAS